MILEFARFLLGYLMIWVVFSDIAALAQWSLHRAALLRFMGSDPLQGDEEDAHAVKSNTILLNLIPNNIIA